MKTLTFLIALILSCHSTSVCAALDYSDFYSLLSDSRKVLSTTVEGTLPGLYRTGARSSFEQAVFQFENSSGKCINQLELDSVTNSLHDAYLLFLRQQYGIQRPLISDNYWEIAADPSKWGSHNLHDPTTIKTRGYYYVYGTDAAWAQTIKGIPYRRSRDLVNWEYLGTVFEGYPSQNNYWADSLTGVTGHTQTGIWAPYIMKVGDEYRLYYCSIHSNPDCAVICLAVSTHPCGPWTQRGTLVNSLSGSNCNAIDPTVIIGKDGKFWMIWGSWFKGLYVTELNPVTGLKKINATETMVAKNRGTGTGWTNSMEGPEIIYNSEFDKYYLFVAEGNLGTIYQTRVARSSNPNGPFLDFFGNSVLYTSKNDIYPLISYAYKFNNHPGWQGVAHSSVIKDNGTYFMLNQGRPTAIPEMMDMHVKKIYWTSDGWPTISPERYANKGIMPEITSELLAGTWEEILLDEYKIGGYSVDVPADGTDPSLFQCKSTTLIFNPNGTIKPNGVWIFDGKRINILKGGYSYSVTPDWEWDWENGCPTLIYTGLRSDGRSYWGKKSMYLDRKEINLVENPYFDSGLKGYSTTSANGNINYSIVTTSANPLDYIKGNTFQAIVNTPSTYYWDQALSWKFPAQKGSRYKVSFSYSVSTSTPINIELQEDGKDFTALYRKNIQFSGTGKYEFITNDVSASDPLYTINFQFGNSVKGVKILLDDISIVDITNQWQKNYVVNGGFENDLDCWNNNFSNQKISSTAIDTDILTGIKSLKIENTDNTITDRLSNNIYWKTNLPGGWKYEVSFDLKGSGSLNTYFRPSTAAPIESDIAGLYEIELTEKVQHKSFGIPVLKDNGLYLLCFSPQNSGTMILDNIELKIIQDSITNVKNLKDAVLSTVRIYPNPCKNTLHFSRERVGEYLEILDIKGQLILKSQINSNQADLSSIKNGLYIARFSTKNGYQTEKLIINR